MRSFSPYEWHQRFLQQAGWTRDLRRHLFSRLHLGGIQSVLDVGCGTGALLHELLSISKTQVVGLDLKESFLRFASQQTPDASLIQGDAHHLPFQAGSFELVLCHFLLLWTASPVNVLQEMSRVVRPGGALLVLAEPDYGGRIDHPAELIPLGQAQGQALAQQGADTQIGRRLSGLLHQVGLQKIEYGILGGQWQPPPQLDSWELEWKMLESDLASKFSPAEFQQLKALDWAACQRQDRVLFVPTFYAMGFAQK